MQDLPTIINILLGLAALGAIIASWFKWISPKWRERRARRKLDVERLRFEVKWLEDHAYLPMFKLDADLNVIWCNDTLTRLLDVDSSQLMGKAWHRTIRPVELDNVIAKWKRAVEDKANFTNTQMTFIGNKYRKVLVTGEVFVYGNKVRGFVGTVKMVNSSLIKEVED